MNAAADSAGLLIALRAIVGEAHVLTDDRLFEGALSEPRGLYRGKALAFVRPGSTLETAGILRACNDAGAGVVPQGGNSGLVGGQTPDESGKQIILSLQRLNKVREVDPLTDTMTLEAGVTLAQARGIADSAGRLFPLSLASEGICTIGGNLSTNAGGVAVIAYGNARDLVTGLEIVLADGRILNGLGKLRKDNTGYDLKHLFIGAEGTLGVITAAALKLFPKPQSQATAFIGLANPAHAMQLLSFARERCGNALTSFELMPRIAIDFVVTHILGSRDPLAQPHAWYVLLELSSQMREGLDGVITSLLEAALAAGVLEDAALATTLEQRKAFWRLRENLPEAQRREGGSIKHDISVPLGAVPEFMAEASAAVAAFMPQARIVAFGHLGDGNIHFNVQQPAGADKDIFLSNWQAMNAVVHAVVARYGGSIAAEHGIGRLKRELLATTKDPTALALMRQIKASLDPKGILNPGKVL